MKTAAKKTVSWLIDGRTYATEIAEGACPFCYTLDSVVALPPPIVAKQTDGATHVCMRQMRGCGQGFEDTSRSKKSTKKARRSASAGGAK